MELFINTLLFFNLSALLIGLFIILDSFGISIPIISHLTKESDYYTKLAKQKSDAIINEAIEKAAEIIEEAEKQKLDIINREKLETRKIEKKYQIYMEQFNKELQNSLEKKTNTIESEYKKFIDETETEFSDNIASLQSNLDENTNIYFKNLQENTNKFLADFHKQSQDQIALDITSIQKELNDYKQTREKIIDENIISILEKILAETLNKSLSLSQHTELVHESLEKAKKEGVFN